MLVANTNKHRTAAPFFSIKNRMLTIGNSANFWRNSWESQRLKSPKSAVGGKKNPISCQSLHLVQGKIAIQKLQNGVMPFGKLQCMMTRKTNFRRGGARLLCKGISSASDNAEVQNCYQLQSARWQHSRQCRVSQASAQLKNCPSLQNIPARDTKWEQSTLF